MSKDLKTYKKLIDFLDRNKAKYRLIDHEPEGRTEIVSPMRGNELHQAAKCMVMIVKIGKRDTKYVLGVIPGDAKMDFDAIKAIFGASYVSFADADIAEKLSGCVSGTVLPLSFNPELKVVVDPKLMKNNELFFNAARLDRSMALKTSDYKRLVEAEFESISLYDDEEEKTHVEIMRHSCAHVMAQAVLEMFPEAKLAIGPDIENGFYYDFELPRTLIPEDLPLIEKKMKHIVKQAQKFEQKVVLIADALKVTKKAGQDYKVELIKDLKAEGEKKVSFYENLDAKGDITFVDMCKGPHTEHTGQVGNFKLTKIAGAYWKGDEKNKMLQRIYGVCFEKKEELAEHLKFLEEAKKRDHRRLGKDLDLFSFHEEAPGVPFWHAKGTLLLSKLRRYWYEVHREYRYDVVSTPIILNENIWHQSGHWDNYKENMYFTEIDETGFAVKPMNCPGGMLVYKTRRHSYRDLPIRSGEFGLVHRHEKSGVLHGLFRVRAFTQDDAHIYCREDQVKDELKKVMEIEDKMYKFFGFSYYVELSTRPEKSIGSDEIWELSENILKEVLDESGLDYQINEGDGAFYGPKIDYHLKDCLGRTWQCGTIQLDFSMPERFDLEYTGEDGKMHRPIMIHRTIYGSLERFVGILIEHYGGAFPVWLAPVQVRVLPVSEKFMDYADEVYQELYDADVRVEIDRSDESLGKKIRNAELQKIPYMIVIGEKEVKGKKIAVRDYSTKEQKDMKVSDLKKVVGC